MGLRLRSLACASALCLTACSALFGVDFDAKERAGEGPAGDPTADVDPADPASSGEVGKAGDPATAGDATTKPPSEAGVPEAGGPPPPPPRACPYPVPASYPWKDRRSAPGACTAAQIDKLAAELGDKPIATLRTELTAVSPTCAACVFSRELDTRWAAFVTNATYGMDDPAGTRMMLNRGGCMSIYGAPLACARAYHNANTCAEERCDGCVKLGSGDACMQAARNDAATCKPYFDQLLTACGSTFAQRLVDCADVTFLLNSFCF